MTAVAPNALRTSRIATEAIHSSQGGHRRLTHILLCFQPRMGAWTIRPNQIIPLSPSEKQARREAESNGSAQVKA
jgi:hypothetical protein